jgi:hypothetical protein
MLGLVGEFRSSHVAYIAPQAAGSSWYLYSFLAPTSDNEPGLGSALNVIDELVSTLEQQIQPGQW